MPINTKKGILSRISARISRLHSDSIREPTEEDMAGFRRAQRLAYQCVTEVEKEMQVGWTEKKTAKLMDTFLKDHGVRTYLHRPFAWFGEHARFDGYNRFTQFHPGRKRLTAHESYILDVSPVVDGYMGDIGYSSCLTRNQELEHGMRYLLKVREQLPGLFGSMMKSSEIWEKIDRDAAREGFDNVHAKYPLAVLGHRVYRVKVLPETRLPRIPISAASWFSLQGQFGFLNHKIFPELLTPDHEGEKLGLWAIEPHFGRGKTGFKFEEILVVERDRAYWLDDDVPHVRRYGATQS